MAYLNINALLMGFFFYAIATPVIAEQPLTDCTPNFAFAQDFWHAVIISLANERADPSETGVAPLGHPKATLCTR